MGRCDLCGDNAGLFKSRHLACESTVETAKDTLRNLVRDGVTKGKTFEELCVDTAAEIRESGFAPSIFRDAMLVAANNAVANLSLAAPLSQDELVRVVDLLKGFGFPEGNREAILKQHLFGMAYASMSSTLHEVQNGRLPYYDSTGRTNFNLRPGEHPIVSAGKVTYAEQRTINTSSRSYGGLSLPVGAGVYYHIGGSQSQKTSGLLPLDVGEMLITTHALNFGGHTRTLRISLARVLRYEPYVDGVGVCESSGPPKVFVPDYSGMDTGWFFVNLLSTLTSRLVV